MKQSQWQLTLYKLRIICFKIRKYCLLLQISTIKKMTESFYCLHSQTVLFISLCKISYSKELCPSTPRPGPIVRQLPAYRHPGHRHIHRHWGGGGGRGVSTPQGKAVIWINDYFLYMAGPRAHISFPPYLILYVNLVAKGAPKFFETLAARLTVVLDVPYFAGAYNRKGCSVAQ